MLEFERRWGSFCSLCVFSFFPLFAAIGVVGEVPWESVVLERQVLCSVIVQPYLGVYDNQYGHLGVRPYCWVDGRQGDR